MLWKRWRLRLTGGSGFARCRAPYGNSGTGFFVRLPADDAGLKTGGP